MSRCFGMKFFLLGIILAGCGADGDATSAIGAAAAAEEADSFGICQMLTDEQVDTVLTDHDGGEVAHAGGSMMEGVDSYQCSYTSDTDDGYSVLALVVSVASSPELLARIRPSNFLYGEDDRVDIADGAFVNDKMDGELGITVIKGLHKIDLDLSSEDAHSLRQEMLGLAATVAGQL